MSDKVVNKILKSNFYIGRSVEIFEGKLMRNEENNNVCTCIFYFNIYDNSL